MEQLEAMLRVRVLEKGQKKKGFEEKEAVSSVNL